MPRRLPRSIFFAGGDPRLPGIVVEIRFVDRAEPHELPPIQQGDQRFVIGRGDAERRRLAVQRAVLFGRSARPMTLCFTASTRTSSLASQGRPWTPSPLSRRHDVDTYRPRVAQVLDKPMFL